MRKRIVSLVLALMMCLSLSVTAFAEDTSTTKTITNEMYGYTITETTDAEGRVIRAYSKQNSVAQPYNLTNDDPYAETKALLADMGMEEDFINHLSEEKLEMYANSPTLASTTSYLETSSNGTTSIVSEQLAETNTSDTLTQKETAAIARLKNLPVTYDSQQGLEEYDYIRLFLLVAQQSGYTYNFSIDSRWLGMPGVRSKDSLGTCAPGMSAIPSSFDGWTEYTVSTIRENGTITRTTDGEDGLSCGNTPLINGNYTGLGTTFDLPNDVDTATYALVYSNYKVHCDFNSDVAASDNAWNFGATGTYCHSTVNLSVTPELCIDNEGTVTFSASFSLAADADEYHVMLADNLHYIP